MTKQKVNNEKLKLNAVMGLINALVNTIVPVFTFIYVARKLNPFGLGINQFATSLVAYFAIFASFGIPLYAVKKLAQTKDDKTKFKKQASELFFFSIITSLLALFVFILFVLISDKTNTNLPVYLVYGVMIIANVFSVEWFYQAREKFTYITVRNVLIKTITLVALLLFIKGEGDYLLYAIISVASTLLYAGVNFVGFFKWVKPSTKNISLKTHIKPIAYVFVFNLAATLYLYIDYTMLGFLLKNDFENAVGQYSVAAKIPRSITLIISSLNAVLLPRLAYNIKRKEQQEVNNLLRNSFSIIFAFALPACVGMVLLADKIVPFFCGAEYTAAILTTQVLAFSILPVALTDLFGLQVFYIKNKMWKTILSCSLGASVNIILNFILIPTHSHLGAGIANLIGILVVLVVQLVLGWKDLNFKKFTWDNFATIMSAGVMLGVLILLKSKLYAVSIINIVLLVVIGMAVYGVSLLIFNHKYLKSTLMSFYKKFFS